MGISRRKFIQSAGLATAGSCLAPSIFLSSCRSSGNSAHVRMDFIGTVQQFKYYHPFFRRLKKASVHFTPFEEALNGNAHAIFLDSVQSLKSTQLVLLMERDKDIITPYPLADNLGEYKNIQEFMVRYDRKIGMLNPLQFYPSVRTLKNWLAYENRVYSEIQVSCHPSQLVPGYEVAGFTGAAQPLQRIISYLTGKFPLSLLAEEGENGGIRHWLLDYGSFQAIIKTDPGQTGWNLQVNGPDMNATTSYTGLLRLNDEAEQGLSPAASIWERSMQKNMEDFIRAVRFRSEPSINSIDGLASIILNEAAEKSMQQGKRVSL